jgi:MFS family permease
VPVVTSPRLGLQALTKRTTAVHGVIAVFFVHGMLFASWVAHIPQVRAHLGIGLGLLGVALLGAPIGSILAMSAAGYLVPRLGSRPVLRTGMIGYCLAGALLGVAENLAAFFLAFMLWGLFQGTLEVAMNTQGVAVESALRRPVMPVFHGSWSLGALAGACIGTLAVALGVPLTSQLLVLGVISLAALAVLTSRLLPSDQNNHHHAPPAGPRPRHGWLTAAVLVLCVVALADMLCEGAAADWSAVYLRSSLHAPGVILGLAYTLYSLVMVATRFSGSRLLAKRPAQRVLPALTALATVGFAAGLAAHDTAITLIAFCCLGAGCALVIPTTYSTVGENASANPGRAVALVSGIGWAGFLAGPPLIGQIASATTLRTALIVIPVLTALITGLMITTRVFRGRTQTPSRAHLRPHRSRHTTTAHLPTAYSRTRRHSRQSLPR